MQPWGPWVTWGNGCRHAGACILPGKCPSSKLWGLPLLSDRPSAQGSPNVEARFGTRGPPGYDPTMHLASIAVSFSLPAVGLAEKTHFGLI